MSPRAVGRGAERRFLLAEPPERGRARLAPEDVPHALRVLRLVAGDRLTGLDGRGGAWPLRVRAVARDALELELDGEPRREPPPGAPGSSLPFLELVVALPRGERAEALATRVTELGAARLVPWIVERSVAAERELPPSRRRRLERAFAEATKQCGRLWLPELAEPLHGLPASMDGESAFLSPHAGPSLLGWARAHAGRGTPSVRLFVGPEGGLTDREEQGLRALGAPGLLLAPHVLRIETAAEAAAAVLVASWIEARPCDQAAPALEERRSPARDSSPSDGDRSHGDSSQR